VGDWRPVEKEGSGHLGIVPESVCLLGGGIGCETAQKGITCSLVGGAWAGPLSQPMYHIHADFARCLWCRPIVDCWFL